MSKVAVWMPVYNERRHLRAALDSVLRQHYRDFTLYVSDNHSSDGCDEIIREYAARAGTPRIVCLRPAAHLPGIEHMKFLWDYVTRQGTHAYSIHIGGHDLWDERHLSILVERMDKSIAAYAAVGRAVAIIYSDTWSIDDDDKVVHSLTDIMQVDQMRPDIIPQFIVTGVRSPHLFGLWNEAIRRQIPVRHCCSGWDHLVVAEAALHGAVLFDGSTQLKMRIAPPAADGLLQYGKKHLSSALLAAGPQDFLNQLEWCVHLIDQSLRDVPEATKSVHQSLLTASMVSLYFVLRGYNLQAVPNATQLFNADPRVAQIVMAAQHMNQQVRMLLNQPQGTVAARA